MDFSFARIKKGDLKLFEQLFREFYSPLCSFANKTIKDKDKAEEVVQDIFYGIWKNKEKMEIKISLKSYLYKAVHNNCLQLIQHRHVEEKYKAHVSNNMPDYQTDPFEEMEAAEMKMVIERTLESLPERCRQVFNMSRIDGLKYKEIAQILDISQKTVEANMGKALNAFRNNLKYYSKVNL